MKFLITGGAGFIGSAVIRLLISSTKHTVLNLDKLTYAGNLQSLESISHSNRYFFERADICDKSRVFDIFKEYKPDVVMHLAAESHVDRSIESPEKFIQTNILGTYVLLEISRKYCASLNQSKQEKFVFHHISTDEVFGDLENKPDAFLEDSAYEPSSPYSASKASSDHLVRAWGRTFNLPFIITNCSNNYGPFQFPEKLIPHVILNAIKGKEIPIYGDGLQVRDWLFVEDHAKALLEVVVKGRKGETYNIGSNNQKTNLETVKTICTLLDKLYPNRPKNIVSYKDLISFVEDRAGHDRRYAIDANKISLELGWKPEETFESGLIKTVQWYIKNEEWIKNILSGEYTLERIGKEK